LLGVQNLAALKDKKLFKNAALLLLIFVGATFIFFPALWVEPVDTIANIFTEAERVGVRKGHGQIFFGEYTRDPGIFFYPIILLLKVSPLTILGMLLFAIWLGISWRKERLGFLLYLFVFYFGYFGLMSVLSKKIDRYMLVLYPLLSLFAVYGFANFCKLLKKPILKTTLRASILGGVIFFIMHPVLKLFPYHFTYTSPVFGSPAQANSVVGQKPFGIGIPRLKDFIGSRYGSDYKLGFIDVKPMKAIYPNSKVIDIREIHPDEKTLVILGPNEEFEGKSLSVAPKFKKDMSIYINGLEYWKIYVHKEEN
jgi:hypothetical protein